MYFILCHVLKKNSIRKDSDKLYYNTNLNKGVETNNTNHPGYERIICPLSVCIGLLIVYSFSFTDIGLEFWNRPVSYFSWKSLHQKAARIFQYCTQYCLWFRFIIIMYIRGKVVGYIAHGLLASYPTIYHAKNNVHNLSVDIQLQLLVFWLIVIFLLSEK